LPKILIQTVRVPELLGDIRSYMTH